MDKKINYDALFFSLITGFLVGFLPVLQSGLENPPIAWGKAFGTGIGGVIVGIIAFTRKGHDEVDG